MCGNRHRLQPLVCHSFKAVEFSGCSSVQCCFSNAWFGNMVEYWEGIFVFRAVVMHRQGGSPKVESKTNCRIALESHKTNNSLGESLFRGNGVGGLSKRTAVEVCHYLKARFCTVVSPNPQPAALAHSIGPLFCRPPGQGCRLSDWSTICICWPQVSLQPTTTPLYCQTCMVH
jgi:hypothetical protein